MVCLRNAGRGSLIRSRFRLWSKVVHDSALGKSWDHSGNYANIRYFGATKKMYVEQKMPDQFGENSGNWRAKQLQVLREEGLKEVILQQQPHPRDVPSHTPAPEYRGQL